MTPDPLRWWQVLARIVVSLAGLLLMLQGFHDIQSSYGISGVGIGVGMSGIVLPWTRFVIPVVEKLFGIDW